MPDTGNKDAKFNATSGYHVRACPNCHAIISRPRCICGYIYVVELITLESYFGGAKPPSSELEANAKNLLLKVNSLLYEIGVESVAITSGYRSPEHNQAIGGAKSSKHCLAQAIDLADNDRLIGDRIMHDLRLLVRRGLHMESLPYCVTNHNTKWVHLQSVAPGSGNTVFQPYSGPPRFM